MSALHPDPSCAFCSRHQVDWPDPLEAIGIDERQLSNRQARFIACLLPPGRLASYAAVAEAMYPDALLDDWANTMAKMGTLGYYARTNLVGTAWTVQTLADVGFRLMPAGSPPVAYDPILGSATTRRLGAS